jgi:hypothetical protein
MSKKKPDRLTECKVLSFEVTGKYGDRSKLWHQLASDCQGLANAFWQCWNAWHYHNNSGEKLKTWLSARANAENPKDAGPCPVEAIPKEMEKELHQLRWRFPAIPSRMSTLLPQRLKRTLQNRKAVKGSLPGYVSIILGREGFQTFTKPYPILFDRANASFVPPTELNGNWSIVVNMVRTEAWDGSVCEQRHTLELWCKGQKVRSQVAILRKIAAGEMARRQLESEIEARYRPLLKGLSRGSDTHKAKAKEMAAAKQAIADNHHMFAGSQLVFSQSRRKWFVKLCFVAPRQSPPELDADKVATLSTRDNGPWLLTLADGKTRIPGGHGRYIGAIRKRLLTQRWDRQANYKNAGSANKGHGRTRSGAGPQWKNFVKRVNSGVVREVLNSCVAAGCGTLVYEQPDGDFRDSRFLATAGKIERRRDSSAWDWGQVRTMLEQRAVDCGITVIVRKVDGSGDDQNPCTPRSDVTECGVRKCGDKSLGNGKPAVRNRPPKRDRSKHTPEAESV